MPLPLSRRVARHSIPLTVADREALRVLSPDALLALKAILHGLAQDEPLVPSRLPRTPAS
jgi:hypothetical protein